MNTVAGKPIVEARKFSDACGDCGRDKCAVHVAGANKPRIHSPPTPPLSLDSSAATSQEEREGFCAPVPRSPKRDAPNGSGEKGGPPANNGINNDNGPLSAMSSVRRDSDPFGYLALASESSGTTSLAARLVEVEHERDELKRLVAQLRGERGMAASMSTNPVLLGFPKPSTLSEKTTSSSSTTLKETSFLTDKSNSSTKQVSFRDGDDSLEHLESGAGSSNTPTSGANSAGGGRGRLMSVGGEVVTSASFMPVKPVTPPVGYQGQYAPRQLAAVSVMPHGNHFTVKASAPSPAVSTSPYVSEKGMVPTRNYKLGGVIGTGSYSKVHLGLNYDSGELVAVKVLEFAANDEQASWWMPRLDSLKSEIDMMKSLQHPNIVRYHFSASDVVNGHHCVNIFMEYVPGGSLYRVVQEFGALPELTVSNYVVQICEALAFIHSKGVVHLDVKNANILLTSGGAMKLADFGTAVLRSSSLAAQAARVGPLAEAVSAEGARRRNTEVGGGGGSSSSNSSGNGGSNEGAKAMRGTMLYMAPEVLRELPDAHAPPADIWSLGCVCMELLTGKPPWAHLGKESTFAIVSELTKDETPMQLPCGLSSDALSFLRCCLAKDPRDRPTAERLGGHAFLERAGSIVVNRAVSAMSMSISGRSIFSYGSSVNVPHSIASSLNLQHSVASSLNVPHSIASSLNVPYTMGSAVDAHATTITPATDCSSTGATAGSETWTKPPTRESTKDGHSSESTNDVPALSREDTQQPLSNTSAPSFSGPSLGETLPPDQVELLSERRMSDEASLLEAPLEEATLKRDETIEEKGHTKRR